MRKRMINKITVALACLATVGCVLSGCQSDTSAAAVEDTIINKMTATEAPAQVTSAPEAVVGEAGQEMVLGGWSLVTDNTPAMMSEADSARIETALGEEGANFDVLDLVATQVVSGMNYMYLVYGTGADGTTPGYYFVTVYEDTKGNDSVIGITPVDVTAIQSASPLGMGATGAWVAKGTGKAGMLPDQDAQASFDAINTGDVMYNPVALLATQLVSGTNYKALCLGNDRSLYVVTWYRDLQGNSSLTSAECVDIGAYSGL